MEEIYYFTKSEITLDDIGAIAHLNGFEVQPVTQYDDYSRSDIQYLNIMPGEYIVGSKRENSKGIEPVIYPDYWQWSIWVDEDNISDVARLQLSEYNPKASFIISHHLNSFEQLKVFICQIMQVYGGWVGCNDDWLDKYDMSTISAMNCYDGYFSEN